MSSLGWTQKYLNKAQLQALESVRNRVKELTKQPFHSHFTDHSVEHSDRVIEILSRVLWTNFDSPKMLNSHEIFVLSLATYLHDIGMQWTYDQTKEKFVDVTKAKKRTFDEIRGTHANRSVAILKASAGLEVTPAPDLGIKAHRTVVDVLDYVADLVQNHQGEYNPKPREDHFSGEVIRLGLLCGLLRIADALDCDHNRVNMEKLKQYDIPLESKLHWWTHHYTKSVRLDSGRIFVSFAFHETLSPPTCKFFIRRVVEGIEEELTLHHDILWNNRVFLTLDSDSPTSSSFEKGLTKLPLPKNLQEYIDRFVMKTPDQKLVPSPEVAPDDEERKPTDWISYWGFHGNPWVDVPTRFFEEEFVETKSLTNIFDEMKSILKGSKGEIKLLVADRGMGKTTFFESLPDIFPFEKFDVGIMNIGEHISEVRNSRELSAIIFSSAYRHMKGKTPDEYDVTLLKDALGEYYKKRPIICFDNLDRFDREEEIQIISQFFREGQAMLQTLGKKALVIISCSPGWYDALKIPDLGYIGARTRWTLKQFSTKEAKELIEKRIRIAGRDVDEIFDGECFPIINSMAKGNPRYILQHCEILCRLASRKEAKKIDKEFIRKNYSREMETELTRLIWDLSAETTLHKRALGSFYYFYETMERGGLDSDIGWNVFIQACESKVPVSQIEEDYFYALSFVTDRASKKGAEGELVDYLKLKRSVSSYMKRWIEKGLTPEDFVSFFSTKPVHPKEFDPEILRHIRDKSLPKDVVWYVDNARDYYKQCSQENLFPGKAVELCWRTVEYLIKANLILRQKVKEGTFSEDRLGDGIYWDKDQRLRRKSQNQLAGEARGLFKMFQDMTKEEGIYIHSMDQIILLMRKREKLLMARMKHKAEALQQAADEAKLCRLALSQAYRDLMGLLS